VRHPWIVEHFAETTARSTLNHLIGTAGTSPAGSWHLWPGDLRSPTPRLPYEYAQGIPVRPIQAVENK